MYLKFPKLYNVTFSKENKFRMTMLGELGKFHKVALNAREDIVVWKLDLRKFTLRSLYLQFRGNGMVHYK